MSEENEMRAQIMVWPKEIGLMTKLRFGADLTGARTQGYQYLLFTEFKDLDQLKQYRDHPTHLRFMEWTQERSCEVLAFDYEIVEIS